MKRHKVAIYRLWAFTWPAMLANICVPLSGVIDAAMLSHLQVVDYLEGIAIGSMMVSSVIWLFSFIRLSITGLSASAYGQHNDKKSVLYLYQGLIFSVVVSLVVLLLRQFFADSIFYILSSPATASSHAQTYFEIRSYAFPGVFMRLAIMGWFIGMQRPKYPLFILVATTFTNILFNIILVIGFNMNIDGIAIGSVIADYTGLIVALVIVYKQFNLSRFKFFADEIFSVTTFSKLLVVNRQLFLRTACLMFVNFFCIYQAIRIGSNVLAANSLMFNLIFLISSALDGFAHTAEALVGKSLSRNNLSQFRLYTQITGICSIICSFFISMILLLGKDYIILALTSIPEIAQEINRYYIWLVLMPIFSCWCYWLDGIFIGALRADKMQKTLIISVFAIFLPSWYASNNLQNHSIWLAYSMFVIARGVTLGIEFYRINKNKKWVLFKI
jgi:MATE family multidrug resistance protein